MTEIDSVSLNDDAVTPLSSEEARVLTNHIKADFERAQLKIVEAWVRGAWKSLDYQSWEDYLKAEFGRYRIKLPPIERREAVASLRQLGMTTRQIAAVVGSSQATTVRDLAHDADDDGTFPDMVIDGDTLPEVFAACVVCGRSCDVETMYVQGNGHACEQCVTGDDDDEPEPDEPEPEPSPPTTRGRTQLHIVRTRVDHLETDGEAIAHQFGDTPLDVSVTTDDAAELYTRLSTALNNIRVLLRALENRM